MSTPKVLLKNEIYQITLIRKGEEKTFHFYDYDFLIMRTDDVDTYDNIDDQGYAYYIFAIPMSQSDHISTPLQPSEAESILNQIFKLTGNYVCDY
jgi:hypothetical protein